MCESAGGALMGRHCGACSASRRRCGGCAAAGILLEAASDTQMDAFQAARREKLREQNDGGSMKGALKLAEKMARDKPTEAKEEEKK